MLIIGSSCFTVFRGVLGVLLLFHAVSCCLKVFHSSVSCCFKVFHNSVSCCFLVFEGVS